MRSYYFREFLIDSLANGKLKEVEGLVRKIKVIVDLQYTWDEVEN